MIVKHIAKESLIKTAMTIAHNTRIILNNLPKFTEKHNVKGSISINRVW